MKAIILNASPRKNWNTAQLLKSAQKGGQSRGVAVCAGAAVENDDFLCHGQVLPSFVVTCMVAERSGKNKHRHIC